MARGGDERSHAAFAIGVAQPFAQHHALARMLIVVPVGQCTSTIAPDDQILVATTTRPGTGALFSWRADRSSHRDSARPQASIAART